MEDSTGIVMKGWGQKVLAQFDIYQSFCNLKYCYFLTCREDCYL